MTKTARKQWMMLRHEITGNFVIANGSQQSVRQFIQRSAKEFSPSRLFNGNGASVDETASEVKIEGVKALSSRVDHVVIGVELRAFRPAEVEALLGGPSKAKAKLSWVPEISTEQMCAEVMATDLEISRKNAFLQRYVQKLGGGSRGIK